MYKIKSIYDFFNGKQQVNTYSHYNQMFITYFAEKYTWFQHMSAIEFKETNDLLDMIRVKRSKTEVMPYYVIYDTFLSKHTNIFKQNNTFIDCGCAPGGFLKFASSKKMKGFGLTLEPSNDNKALDLETNDDLNDYNVRYGDLLNSEFVQSVISSNESNKVDFINMGAVFYDKTDSNNSVFQNKLFLNQLYLTKSLLKQGGSFMFVYDIFHTFYNFFPIMLALINLDCEIEFIPVQPAFMTSQSYVLVKNVRNFDDAVFDKIYNVITKRYIPIVKKNSAIKKVISSTKINYNTLRTVYYIKLLQGKYKLKNDKISNKMIPVLTLDIINRSNYNGRYIKYRDDVAIEEDAMYNANSLPITYRCSKMLNEMRDNFIVENNLIETNGELHISDPYDMTLCKKIKKLTKKMNKVFFKLISK